ncbi:proline-rich receptor-like protein kinase PERK2 isoform X1 [Phacochoerus africanus]|uniref:proline-rich receptor-like protein kinase PERK2 isoform X1 n=1 Tax=Phacochoerus africanus TaxID=41426 RepID=UPI001FD93DF6|nr:proline-rich receptor-like protein kinase PERK2 isoform X1 [Phacochoerus africanus]
MPAAPRDPGGTRVPWRAGGTVCTQGSALTPTTPLLGPPLLPSQLCPGMWTSPAQQVSRLLLEADPPLTTRLCSKSSREGTWGYRVGSERSLPLAGAPSPGVTSGSLRATAHRRPPRVLIQVLQAWQRPSLPRRRLRPRPRPRESGMQQSQSIPPPSSPGLDQGEPLWGQKPGPALGSRSGPAPAHRVLGMTAALFGGPNPDVGQARGAQPTPSSTCPQRSPPALPGLPAPSPPASAGLFQGCSPRAALPRCPCPLSLHGTLAPAGSHRALLQAFLAPA